MKNYSYLLLFLILLSNCTLNKVSKYHGVRFLEKKQNNLLPNVSNKNDILLLLGPPSTKSNFDNDIWIYLERIITKQPLIKMGSNKTIVNNVLVLEINNMGLLASKNLYNLNDMNELNFSTNETKKEYSKRSFVYNFLSSMRQKINDPLNKRKKP
tara:strand:- start:64 stop:528 length:465 start_codon:yes stop_codon:yes gene_type:complete